MSLETGNEILAAVEHLPNGATLVVHEFSWDAYEELLESLADRPALRVSYDSGRLEIMSPSPVHGSYESLIEDLVLIFCETFHLSLQKFGRATWKRRSLDKGVEPDASYYVRNAKRMIGKAKIDLESDPPPDIAVEVDVTNSSLGKFQIFAALGIPEVWRYSRKACRFYALADGKYDEIRISRFLPRLTGEMIADAIEISNILGQDEARSAFRRRIKTLRKR